LLPTRNCPHPNPLPKETAEKVWEQGMGLEVFPVRF
jgi:hypothetical protein